MAVFFMALALAAPGSEPVAVPLIFFAFGALFAIPALFGGALPTRELTRAAGRKLEVARRLRNGLVVAAYAVFAVVVASRSVSLPHLSPPHRELLIIIASLMWAVGFLLRFVEAYYLHYRKAGGAGDAV
jgi:hypothetical protein